MGAGNTCCSCCSESANPQQNTARPNRRGAPYSALLEDDDQDEDMRGNNELLSNGATTYNSTSKATNVSVSNGVVTHNEQSPDPNISLSSGAISLNKDTNSNEMVSGGAVTHNSTPKETNVSVTNNVRTLNEQPNDPNISTSTGALSLNQRSLSRKKVTFNVVDVVEQSASNDDGSDDRESMQGLTQMDAEEEDEEQDTEEEEELRDSDKLTTLIQTKLSDEAREVLGDPTSYEIPADEVTRLEMGRDVRKIKVSLLSVQDFEQRVYAKITIFRHYQMLNSIYKRYCKIAGDTQWLTMFGWISLLRDCGMIAGDTDTERDANELRFIGIFNTVYTYHREHYHSARGKAKSRHSVQLSDQYGDQNWHDKDPWTGLWMLEQDQHNFVPLKSDGRLLTPKAKAEDATRTSLIHELKEEASRPMDDIMQYKLRKSGDRKIVGCIIDDEESKIVGWLDRKDFKIAKLQIKRTRQSSRAQGRKTWECQLIPPEHELDPVQMKVHREHRRRGGVGKMSDDINLFKYYGLDDDDPDLPLISHGLARHEFFDALLCVARMMNEMGATHGNNQPLYKTMDMFVSKRLDPFVYQNMVELKQYLSSKGDIQEETREKLTESTSAVILLFKRYAAAHHTVGGLDDDAWCALAQDLCAVAKSSDKQIWKRGGKPSLDDIMDCFTLSKSNKSMEEELINMRGFQRCFLHFTAAMFRKKHGAQYTVKPLDEKLDLVLTWCETLNAQGAQGMFQGAGSKAAVVRKVDFMKSESLGYQTMSPDVSVDPYDFNMTSIEE